MCIITGLCMAGVGAHLLPKLFKSRQWRQVSSYVRFEDLNKGDHEMEGMSENDQRRSELRDKYSLNQ